MTWDLTLTIASALAFTPCLIFVVQYHFTTRGAWVGSATGRNIMLLMVSLVLALGLILFIRVLGRVPGFNAIALAVYLGISYAATRRCVLQSRAQSRLRHTRTDHTKETR